MSPCLAYSHKISTQSIYFKSVASLIPVAFFDISDVAHRSLDFSSSLNTPNINSKFINNRSIGGNYLFLLFQLRLFPLFVSAWFLVCYFSGTSCPGYTL